MRRGALLGALILTMSACDSGGGTTTDTRQEDTQDAVEVEATPDTSVDTSVDTAADSAAETTPDTTPTLVTWDDVYPIFRSSCTPCHGGATPTSGPSGGHSIASPDKAVAYQASQLDAKIAKCAGKKIGECALIRIRDGSMPANGACREPQTAQCPDANEQTLIEQWITDGMLEAP